MLLKHVQHEFCDICGIVPVSFLPLSLTLIVAFGFAATRASVFMNMK